MKDNTDTAGQLRSLCLSRLREALARNTVHVQVDHNGYVESFERNLLPLVNTDQFEEDLRRGDGNELEGKFRAAHSSSALAVNTFAPFKNHPDDLLLPTGTRFKTLNFERKCPTGLRGGRAPNLDVLLESNGLVLGIESKMTEFLGRHVAEFSPAYQEQIQDERRNQGYFAEMQRLKDAPRSYSRLDAAQLIKHAFGLTQTFRGKEVALLYLYWEPSNAHQYPIFLEHRSEVHEFSQRVAGASPTFFSMSYLELWSSWREVRRNWVQDHLKALIDRYLVTL